MLWRKDDPRRVELIKRNKSDAQRQAASRGNAGKKYGIETREKIRQARLGTKASPETRRKLSRMRMGHKVSGVTRERQRASNLQTWKSPVLLKRHSQCMKALAEEGKNRVLVWKDTVPEMQLVEFLSAAGFRVEREKQFGRFRIDAYLPDEHLAFEADGIYWHDINERKSPGYYARRDQELLERFGLPVARLTDEELGEISHTFR